MTQNNPSKGSIVSWQSPKEIPFSVLRSALVSSNFDEKLAREMLPRNAFSRAAKELSDKRIIKKTEEDKDTITFQFTKEWLEQQEYKFQTECFMTVHKEHGTVVCLDSGQEHQDLAALAQKMLYAHQEKRNTSDISRIIQKIFEEHKGDLIPIRASGGAYFVPVSHQDLVTNIRAFLKATGGYVSTFSVRIGDEDTDQSVAEAMAAHISDLVLQFEETCDKLDPDSADWMVDRRQKSLKELRDKLECYKGLLGVFAEGIGEKIQNADSKLLEKIKRSMGADDDVTESTTEEPVLKGAVTTC